MRLLAKVANTDDQWVIGDFFNTTSIVVLNAISLLSKPTFTQKKLLKQRINWSIARSSWGVVKCINVTALGRVD